MRTTTQRLALPVLGILCATLTFTGVSAKTINVPADWQTIQEAVTAAAPGDTIQCAAGNYAAGANLNKPLTLKGAQAGVDARDGRPGAQESVITAGGLGVFYLNSEGITFDGFTFSDLKGRTVDTYFNADNFTMRNCILKGSSIDPGYNTGAIQFGGGQNLHANGLLFEQNLVTADNGQLFYMGHAMDNGTVRNNKFNGDTVSFGPFGNRTGWVIEGNVFNGDVPGHGPYWGFAFNANLGDVIIRSNIVSKMSVGIGQISVVGGVITGNTFDDNQYAAFQLWGGEWGSVVSANALIEHNKFSYNGDFANASHAMRLRPGLDASTIHIYLNSFENLGLGTGWAIRQNGNNTADSVNNWWNTQDPSVIATMFGEGLVKFDPWIVCYTDDPAKAGQPGFWPIDVSLSNEGPITSEVTATPNPVVVGETIHLNAIVAGCLAIQAAEYSLDGGTTWAPMTAVDGAFDEATEDVAAIFTLFTPGDYSVRVRGANMLGAVGPEVCITLTVVGPSQIKAQIRDALVVMLPTLSVAGDRTKLQDAINHLNKSLAPALWLDAMHPKPGAMGETVFNEEKAVVTDLKALRDGNKSRVAPAVFQGYIDAILAVDRKLAEIAIMEAAGGKADKIQAANAELLKGDVEASKDHPDKAIDHYKNSWKNAIEA